MAHALLEVALPLPLQGSFTYRWPEEQGDPPSPGVRVVVPFGARRLTGWVLGPGVPSEHRLRSVDEALDRVPLVRPDLLELARWMSRYYVAPPGQVLRSMLPSVLSEPGRERVSLTEGGTRLLAPGPLGVPPQELDALSPPARAVLAALGRMEGEEVPLGALRQALGRSPRPGLLELEGRGLVHREILPPPAPPVRTRRVVQVLDWLEDLARRDEIFGRARRQRECFELLVASGGSRELGVLQSADGFSRSVVSGLEEKGLVELADREVMRDPFAGDPSEEGGEDGGPPGGGPPPALTPDQETAVRELRAALDEARPRPFLLHGVTGSGKTRVYIELLQEAVEARGRTAIVLVPEIALTPQTVGRFRDRFGDRVAVLHSGLSDGERWDQWRQLASGEKRIVVGARSALFAPLPELGVIVVDEEHDGSYKQSETPRYHARDLAVLRARMTGAVCVLGSATPSLESWQNVEAGKFRWLSLPRRVGNRPLPPVQVVDLRVLRKEGNSAILSPLL
ncbi:MAG: primosomal protein N', partial [Gemmatimonadales bacterium]